MTLRAPKREPSKWEVKKNGGADHIPGFDDGEPHREYRSATPGEPLTGDISFYESLPEGIY